MKRIAWIAALIVGAAGFALIVAHERSLARKLSGGDPVEVLVAARDIAIGERLDESMLGVRTIPSSYIERRHILAADARRALGVRVSLGVRAGEALLWSDLATGGGDRRDLSSLVTPGMRAVSIQASVTSRLGGLLRPGDRVDILLTTDRASHPVTVPLLQNVLVLAVGGDTGASGEVPLIGAKSDVTVSVTLEQAQALALAPHEGELVVALRHPEDITVVEDLPETTSADILEPQRRARLGARRTLAAPAAEPPSGKEIEHVH